MAQSVNTGGFFNWYLLILYTLACYELISKNGLAYCYKKRSVQVLVKAVEDATQSFIERGIEIARENPELRTEMEEAIEDTRRDGEVMSKTSHAFAEDPCSSMKVKIYFVNLR